MNDPLFGPREKPSEQDVQEAIAYEAFVESTRVGHISDLEKLLEEKKVDPSKLYKIFVHGIHGPVVEYRSLLETAIDYKSPHAVTALLKAGADPNIISNDRTPLDHIYEKGQHLASGQVFFNQQEENMMNELTLAGGKSACWVTREQEGWTRDDFESFAFHLARHGDVETLRSLLMSGLTADCTSLARGGHTLAIEAALHNKADIVRGLIAYGANPNALDSHDFKTARTLYDVLEQNGAFKDGFFSTAMAVQSDMLPRSHFEEIISITKIPDDINTPLGTGFPILHLASLLGNIFQMRGVLDLGADINSTTEKTKLTALHVALISAPANPVWMHRMVEALIFAGADPCIKDPNGADAFTYAARNEGKIKGVIVRPSLDVLDDAIRKHAMDDFFRNFKTIDQLHEESPLGVQGDSWLHLAARTGYFPVVIDRLIERDVKSFKAEDIFFPSNDQGYSPIDHLLRVKDDDGCSAIFRPELWAHNPHDVGAIATFFPMELTAKIDLEKIEKEAQGIANSNKIRELNKNTFKFRLRKGPSL